MNIRVAQRICLSLVLFGMGQTSRWMAAPLMWKEVPSEDSDAEDSSSEHSEEDVVDAGPR